MEKFSDDEAVGDEVVFKLVDGAHGPEQILDEKP